MTTLDDEALRELLPRLRRFAYSLTRDLDNADDLVQSCLEKAINVWHQRRPESDLRAWLFTILYRQFVDTQRRQRRFSRLISLFGADSAMDETDGEALSATADNLFEANKQLAAFSLLPYEQRALLLLVAVEGLSYQAISEQLEIPLGTVMSRVSRARQAFRRLTQDGGSATTKLVLRVLKND
jgi:RNA polymerase sigma-70 factor (ECF subfamily)